MSTKKVFPLFNILFGNSLKVIKNFLKKNFSRTNEGTIWVSRSRLFTPPNPNEVKEMT